MTENAYIHIPFCVKKCNYCAFTSFCKLQNKKEYLIALEKEIKENYKKEYLKTLYFGGGTPSLLSVDEVAKILSLFNCDKNTEITFEVNPNKLKIEYLSEIRKLGINRLSIGSQTFNEKILKIIGRLHTPTDIENAVKNSRKAGFDNISLDLIYGLPEQDLTCFKKDLNCVVVLGVEHVSLYGLKIEKDTEFYYHLPKNLPNDDNQADMYLKAGEILRENGFEKYEISNFAKKGYESKHNLNYWNANTYYGFGCGACGYEDNKRYDNLTNLDEYIKTPLKKQNITDMDKKSKLEESVFLGFRKADGINVSELKEKFGFDFEEEYKEVISKFLNTGHLIKTQNGYAFSDSGFLLSNEILCEFM